MTRYWTPVSDELLGLLQQEPGALSFPTGVRLVTVSLPMSPWSHWCEFDDDAAPPELAGKCVTPVFTSALTEEGTCRDCGRPVSRISGPWLAGGNAECSAAGGLPVSHEPPAGTTRTVTAISITSRAVMDRWYRCASCGGFFQTDWTDADAHAERAATWVPRPGEQLAVVCDDCYQQMLSWAQSKAPGILR